jgi:hypothetical protein
MNTEVNLGGEVAAKVPNEIAAAGEGAWGAEGVDNTDILIPKLLLMQGLSTLVAEGKAAVGDIVNSVTGQVLGNRTKGVDVIPFFSTKSWVYSEKRGEKYEFVRMEPYTAANADRALEGIGAEGVSHRYDRALNFYALVAAEATNLDALPILLSFRRTSYTAGKKIATFFKQCEMLKLPPASKVLTLTSSSQKNDLGTFSVFEVVSGRGTTKEEVAGAYRWYTAIKKGMHKVDNSDLTEDRAETTDATTPF